MRCQKRRTLHTGIIVKRVANTSQTRRFPVKAMQSISAKPVPVQHCGKSGSNGYEPVYGFLNEAAFREWEEMAESQNKG